MLYAYYGGGCVEILQLKYFCEAARYMNISKAAEKMGVPSPGVSYSIRRLEKELGISLFTRGANKVHLTDEGRIFADEVERALEILETAKTRVTSSKDEVKGEIRVSVLVNNAVMNKIISEFKIKYPEVKLRINNDPNVKSGEDDIIISDELFYFEAYDKRIIISENLMFAANKNNPIVQSDIVDEELLRREKFIMMKKDNSLYHHAKRICFEKGFIPEVTIYTDNPYDARTYIESGVGVGIVPEYAWGRFFSENVVMKKISDDKRNTCLFFRRERRKIQAVDLLCDMIENFDYNI